MLVLIDSRHGIKEVDRDMMEMLDKAAVSYRLVLTKADKIKASELAAVMEATAGRGAQACRRHPDDAADLERRLGGGIAELRAAVLDAITPH